MILATLNNPREKFWGSILALDPAGLSMAGLELSSVDDCTNMVISGEEFAPATLFFPMHRVERIELDAPQGDIPSLSQRFLARTGQEATSVFSRTPASAIVGTSGATDSRLAVVTESARNWPWRTSGRLDDVKLIMASTRPGMRSA